MNANDIVANLIPGNTCLRFDLLYGQGDFKKKCQPLLKKQNVRLDKEVTTAIARLATSFGVGISVEQTSHFVADIVQGFGICLERHTSQEWAYLASVFEMTLVRSADLPVALRNQSIKKS